MLKIATHADLDLITEMALKFAKSTDYSDLVEEDHVQSIVDSFLSSRNDTHIILLHGEAGMLAGTVGKFPYGPYKVATEFAWWVEPDKRKTNIGKELLEAFEFWAKKIGCDFVHMVSLDEAVGKYYEKQGYKLYERAYMKDL